MQPRAHLLANPCTCTPECKVQNAEAMLDEIIANGLMGARAARHAMLTLYFYLPLPERLHKEGTTEARNKTKACEKSGQCLCELRLIAVC